MLLRRRFGHLAAGLFRLAVLAGLLAGVPYGLVTQIGWPLPRTFPRTAEQVLPQLQQWLTTPVTDQVVLNLLAVAMWILWGSFTASVIVEFPSRIRGVVPRRVPVLAPMQSLAGWLLTGITAGMLATGTLAAPAPSAADPVPTLTQVVPDAAPAGGATTANTAGPGTAGVEAASYTTTGGGDRPDRADEQLLHEVARGDWMWHIAGRYLGDEDRYPEIAQLNPTYTDRYEDYPDHIEPGDQLVLPDDARDRGQRPHATGDTILTSPDEPTPDPPPPAAPVQPPAPPSPPYPPSSSPPAGVTHEPRPPPATPEATPPPPAEHGTPGPGAGDAPGDEEDADDQPAASPVAGVVLPSGAWVSLGLAALLAAVATVLRLSRRRRTRLAYPIEITTEPEPSPVPATLRPADVAGLRALETTDNDEQDDSPLAGVMPAPPATPAAVGVDEHGEQVSLFDLPGDGLCLHGEGAMPAGRAILAAACSTGVSQFPGARPMVLTSVDTLAALLPNGVAPEGLDPHGTTFDGERLTVASDVGLAVTRAEEEMIARRRLLDDLDADTMDALNADDDHAEQQPRFLLLLRDAGRYKMRLRVLAACRQVLHMHVVILDQQLDNLSAVHVAADGTYTTPTGSGRLSTLAAGDLAQVLDLVRQALPRPQPEPDLEPAPPASTTAAELATATVPTAGFDVPQATGEQLPPVRLFVFGPVRLETDTGPVTSGLRGRAYGVLALLAAHPKGRTLEEIIDDLQPEDGLKDVRAAVRAAINSVRATLRKTTGVAGKYLPYDNSTGRYTIDPNLISVDLWRMLAAIDRANALVDDDTACLAALREATACYGGDFAEGQDRAWVIDYATTYRGHLLSVYGRIAEILELDAPDQAIAALERAAELDPVNEEIAQRIMRIHGRQQRPDAVRRTLRQLENRIAQIGHAEVSEATRRVAARQLASR